MAGRVDDLHLPRTERERFAAFDNVQILRWNGKSLSEKSLQVVGPQSLRARKQLGRINHVRRAVRVYVHGKPRILAHQRAGSAGMVQMNVRQKNGVEIAHTNASGSEALAQSLERRTRAGIDNGAMPVRFK